MPQTAQLKLFESGFVTKTPFFKSAKKSFFSNEERPCEIRSTADCTCTEEATATAVFITPTKEQLSPVRGSDQQAKHGVRRGTIAEAITRKPCAPA